VKARSVFVGLLACPRGHHAAFLNWHDLDHRPENHGQIPHIFHSARWIAPPDSLERREFEAGSPFADAGQYAMTYWSTAEPEQLIYDMTVLRDQLAGLGRCQAIGRDFKARWRERMHPVQGYVDPALGLSPDSAMLMPHDGLVVTVGEQPEDGGAWSAAYAREMLPGLFGSGSLVAALTLMTRAGVSPPLFVHLHYVRGDLTRAQETVRQAVAGPRILFRGAYVPQHWSQPRFFE
jgi:hypothetical protein